MIRKAKEYDIPQVVSIYEEILSLEEAGKTTTGWMKGIYPVEKTALSALSEGTLYVLEEDGKVLASAVINQKAADGYDKASWEVDAKDDEVLVIHTLTVSPSSSGKGYGTEFIRFYESMGKEMKLKDLRLDTNEKNKAARALYKKLGYTEVGIVESDFNGLGKVNLVFLEKKVQ